MITVGLRRLLGGLLLLLAGSVAAQNSGQQLRDVPTEELTNYTYAAILGTGTYKINDRRVTIFRIPAAWTLRDVDEQEPGIRLLMPFTFGFHDFDFSDALETRTDDIATLSFLPGAELAYRPHAEWLLRPYAQYGYAWDLSNSNGAWLYNVGARARWQRMINGVVWSWGNEVSYAGENPKRGRNTNLGLVQTSVESRLPMPWSYDGDQTYLGLYVTGLYYFDELEFNTALPDPIEERAEAEIGISIGLLEERSWLGFGFDRIGLGYRFGGDVDAIVLVTDFPF